MDSSEVNSTISNGAANVNKSSKIPARGYSDCGVRAIFRNVQYHGLKIGTMRVTVKDLVCNFCGKVNIFDGHTWGMFS